MSKAQLTGFILIGILSMSILGGAIYIANDSAKDRVKSAIGNLGQGLLQTSAAEFYISECFDQSVKDGIELIGKQGGMIYEDQIMGTPVAGIVDYSSVYDEGLFDGINYLTLDTRINYGIFQKREDPHPKYGYYSKSKFNTYNKMLELSRRTYSKVLGSTSSFVPLCDKDGLNGKKPNPDCYSSFYSNRIQEYSTQKMLESYISNKTMGCLNVSLLESKFGYELVPQGVANTSVLFGNDDLHVQLKYPIEIRVKGKSPATKVFDFSNKYPVRFKKMYEYSNHLANEEMRNIEFNIDSAYDNVLGYDNALDVKVSGVPPCGDCLVGFGREDNVITITDSLSQIKGEDFSMRFAVKNRHPYLDLIRTIDPDGKFGSLGFDIAVLEGTDILIEPRAVDPDGDEIKFSYSGWKETEKDSWNTGLGVDCKLDLWGCTESVLFDLFEWTTSEDYDEKLGIAKVGTGIEDIGAHSVTLTVTDEYGFSDWQVINILVWPLAILNVQVSSLYEDVGPKILSIEDPVLLDASGSVVSMGFDNDQYGWEITSEGGTLFTYTGDGLKQILPEPSDIKSIKNDNLKETTQDSSSPYDTYTVKFSYDSGPYTTDPFIVNDIKVYQCLPHESDYAPYPYNGIVGIKADGGVYVPGNNINNFDGDHVCCNDDTSGKYGTYKDDVDCFRYEEYSINPTLRDGSGTNIKPANVAMKVDSNGDLELYGDVLLSGNFNNENSKNDVFKRVYTVECDGTRGNVCAGEVKDEYIIDSHCKDISAPDATCSGPDSKDNPTTCTSYGPGNTFEKAILGDNTKVYCDESYRSAVYTGRYEFVGSSNAKVKCQSKCRSGECNYATASDCLCLATEKSYECGLVPGTLINGITNGICDYNCQFVSADESSSVCTYNMDGIYNAGILKCCGGSTTNALSQSGVYVYGQIKLYQGCCVNENYCIDINKKCRAPGTVGSIYTGNDINSKCISGKWVEQ